MPAIVKDEYYCLLVGPRDRCWGLFVTAAGLQFIPSGARFRPTGHSPSHDYLWQQGRILHEYAIVYTLRGQAEFESEPTGRKTVDAGSVILLFPEVWHRYRPIEAVGWDSYWVTYQGDYADRLRQQGFLSPDEAVLSPGLDDLILRPFTSLLDRVRSQPLGLQQLVATDTLAILAGIQSALCHQQTSSHIQEVVRQAKLAIEAADGLPMIEALAEASGLGRSRFYQVFKECTGVSPYQYHLHLRICRAKELLRGSALSIKQIAAMLTFDSVYQFSRIFKKKTGLSPTEYRSGDLAAKPRRVAPET
jgi:AraC-like DNA-binding protein